jgi:hypothetical protein
VSDVIVQLYGPNGAAMHALMVQGRSEALVDLTVPMHVSRIVVQNMSADEATHGWKARAVQAEEKLDAIRRAGDWSEGGWDE